MFNNPKYIKIDDPVNGESLILFPCSISHGKMYTMVKSAYPGIKIVSAGFINLEIKHCYGKSTSLNLKSDETDSILLEIQFFND